MAQAKERLLHHVTVSVFSKPHDRREDVLKGLDAISPVPTQTLLSLEPEHDAERPHTIHYRLPDVTLTAQETDSDEGRMTIYTLFFRKISAVNSFAKKLVASMTPQEREEYRGQPALLLDGDGKLTVRLDKELLMRERLSLTDDGQCYLVKASVAAYPKSGERIIEVVRQILERG